MGRIAKKSSQLDEMFPDRQFTKEEMRKFSQAVKRDGGKWQWLAKKGFITLDEKTKVMRSVIVIEGITGQEVIKGSGIRYKSDIPYTFWSDQFELLRKYEYGIEKGQEENLESLDEVAKTLGSDKKITGLF